MKDTDRTLGSEPTYGAPNDVPTLGASPKGQTPILPFSVPDETPTVAPKPASAASVIGGPLPPGPFGTRYQILRLLGAGGMGAVYQAWDSTLGVVVALKVILPDVASDPEVLREIERRFKRELLLARQVTHKNVVRINDLGEIDGIKYITMAYIEGEDLATVLKREGKVPISKALQIARQAAAGLHAAHEAGVVHRDLKPANIMVEGDQALIMDFGIAVRAVPGAQPALSSEKQRAEQQRPRNAASTGTGEMVGTIQYMPPEQSKGEEADQRSDIYSFGLILYDMLLGRESRSGGRHSLEELQSRLDQAPPSLRSIDPNIPEATDRLVSRCVQPNPADRFQTTTDLVAALGQLDDQGELIPVHRVVSLPVVGALVSLSLVLLGGGWWYAWRSIPPKQQQPVSVVIADFQNSTQDAAFDGVLEQALSAAMEGASFVNSYSRSTARKEAVQLGAQTLNAAGARLVALRDGLNVIISGTISGSGPNYTVSAEAVDAAGKQLAQSQINVTKETLLASIPKLAQPIRSALGDRASGSKVEEANTFTAGSLEAAHLYGLGADAALALKYEDAMQYYQQALALDPNLARAYSGMAVIYRNLGDLDKAEENFKIALSKPGLTQRERFRIRGGNYITTFSYEKAVDEYNSLLQQFPGDNAGHANIALAYSYLRNMPRAVEEAVKAIQIYPKNVGQRSNVTMFMLYAGRFEEAAREADEVIKLNPKFEDAYVVKALTALAGGNPDQATAAYDQLGNATARGASIRLKGLGDIALYEGRNLDAVTLLQAGAKADMAAGEEQLFAEKQVELAHTLELMGQRGQAVAAAEQALKATKNPETEFLAARVLVETGQETSARHVAQLLSNQLGKEQQAYGKLLEGEIALQKKTIPEAIRLIEESQKLVDTWISRFDLGRAYLAAEHFTEADSEFDACIRRSGEATSLQLDANPTYGYFPPVYYYAGRAKQGIGSPDAAEFYKRFLAIRGKATNDPLVADANKRLTQ
jgi:serine/threonine protein kinase/Tfp pilus assembly protein PilF